MFFLVDKNAWRNLRISKHPKPPSSHLLLCQLVQKRRTIHIMDIIVPASMCPDEIDFIARKGSDVVHCRGGVPVLVGGGGRHVSFGVDGVVVTPICDGCDSHYDVMEKRVRMISTKMERKDNKGQDLLPRVNIPESASIALQVMYPP